MTLAMSFCHKRADLLLDIWLLYFVVFFTEGKFSFFMFTITSPHALLCYIVWSGYFLVLLCFSFLFLLFLFLFWVCSVNSCGSLSLFMRKILKGIQLFLLFTFISTCSLVPSMIASFYPIRLAYKTGCWSLAKEFNLLKFEKYHRLVAIVGQPTVPKAQVVGK